jgi:hypothetical protein
MVFVLMAVTIPWLRLRHLLMGRFGTAAFGAAHPASDMVTPVGYS